MTIRGNRVVTAPEESVSVRRISWAAILAGVTITLVVQLALGILGLGIGASTINPLTEENPVAGIGIGAGIWFLVSALIALFAGGYVAGHMAGVLHRQDGLLHGLLTWSLATLLTFYFLTSTVGGLIGGAASILGRGLAAVGSGAAVAVPAIAGATGEQLEDVGGLDLSALQSQIETLLNQAGVDTSAVSQAVTTTQQVTETVSEITDDPQSRQELAALINRIATSDGETFSAADREELINFIVEHGGRSREEAEELVAELEQTYQEARAQYQEALAQAEQTAREAGAATAEGVSTAAIWTFIGLLISAAAAAAGGYVATPRDLSIRAGVM